MSKNRRLTFELVPQTTWNSNLRSILKRSEWDMLRRKTYEQAGYVCEICGGKGNRWPVECHERWEFDGRTHTQKLIGLIALCPACHMAKHIGLAEIKGFLDATLKHYAAVNGLTMSQAAKDLTSATNLWNKRSQVDWKVDISWARAYLKGKHHG